MGIYTITTVFKYTATDLIWVAILVADLITAIKIPAEIEK